MLEIYVKFMILLVVLKTLRNTFLTNVGLVIMESYLRILRVFYNYYDVQQIQELVAFRGTCQIASFIEECDTTLYKSENFAIFKYCYDNYASNAYV